MRSCGQTADVQRLGGGSSGTSLAARDRPMSTTASGPIIVTGDTGFIGAAIVRRLADRYIVIGFNRRGQRQELPNVEAETVDVTSDEAVIDGLRAVRERHGSRITSVIHLAAYYDFSGEPSPMYERVTVRGTERLLRGLADFEVGQFVFSSTMLVHAPTEPGERISARDELGPTWTYPRSKLETERLIRELRGTMPAVLLRISGVYDEMCHSVPLANQIQRIAERRLTSRLYPGDTERGQAFLHLDDLVGAIDRVVEHRGELAPELAVVLGEPDVMSYAELQDELGRLIHGEEEWRTVEIPKLVAKAGAWAQDVAPVEDPFIKPWMVDRSDDHYALDIDRARRMLGWEPRRRLRNALPAMVAALRRDPERFYRENGLGDVPDQVRGLAFAS